MRLSSINHQVWLGLIWLLPILGAGWTVAHAPAWLEPHRLTVALEPGQSIVLGRETLAALQADGEHVRVNRERGGSWRLANLSPSKQVVWQPGGGRDDRLTREWLLTSGAMWTIGAHTFTVSMAKPDRLILQSGGQRWEYDGFNLHWEGRRLPECHEHWRTHFREYLGHLPGLHRGLQRPLRLGGGVYCADRLGLAGVPIDTALLVSDQAGFVLRSGAAGRPDSPPVIVAAGTPEAESLWQRSVPLAVGDQLIIGRTWYRVAQTTPALELTVLTRAWRWLAGSEPPAASPNVSVQWRAMAWLWPSDAESLGWPLGLGLVTLTLGRVVLRRSWRIATALGLAGACLGLYVSRLVAPILWPYLLAWPVLGIGLMTVRSLWSARLLATLTVLLGIGWIALLQLATGAGESGWSRYGGSSAALAGMCGWLVWVGWNDERQRPLLRWPSRCWARWGLRLLSGAAVGLLFAQVVWGDENGWCGFQPFELTKLALVIAAAYGLAAGGLGWRSFKGMVTFLQGLHYLSPVVLLAMVSSFALTFLRDFSPLVLLAFWMIALGWAVARVHSRPVWRRLGQLTILALVLFAVAGLAWLRERPEKFPLDFQADRIRVWAAPAQYPHVGYQLRRALEAIHAGGWQGTIWKEPVNGQIMTVPAVEDDFMPAFFMSRYGGWAALALVGIQAMFIGILLIIADRAARQGRLDSDRWATPEPLFIYFTLYGGAGLLIAHFVVSWGTNLGFLPVMGQPMSLLSAAGSHLILLVMPIVALAVAVEEKNDDNPP